MSLIARYHRDSLEGHWLQFSVDKYGQIFEGRAGGIDQAVIGAQAQGFNGVLTGIARLGDFSAFTQSPRALRALGHLIAWKLSVHRVPVLGTVAVTSARGPNQPLPGRNMRDLSEDFRSS